MSFPGKILSNKTLDSTIKCCFLFRFIQRNKELVAERHMQSSLSDSAVIRGSLKDFLGKLNTLTET